MTPQELRDRTKRFAIAIVRLCRSLPGEWGVRVIGRQLLRSGTAVAANYRASNRARSDREFCSKIGVVLEEADESQLWLELLAEGHPTIRGRIHDELTKEAAELTAIFTASFKTSSDNLRKRKVEQRNGAKRKRP
jgi:four helix bundle protein